MHLLWGFPNHTVGMEPSADESDNNNASDNLTFIVSIVVITALAYCYYRKLKGEDADRIQNAELLNRALLETQDSDPEHPRPRV
jgi:hypothetical protein